MDEKFPMQSSTNESEEKIIMVASYEPNNMHKKKLRVKACLIQRICEEMLED